MSKDWDRAPRLGGKWGEVRVERPSHDPDAHVISTYYNYKQRQRHDAARRRAMVEVTAGAKALLFGVVAALVVLIGISL